MNRIRKYEYRKSKAKNIFLAAIRKTIGHKRFKRNYYNGKRIGDYEMANKTIFEALKSQDSFFAGRFGDTELRVVMYTLEIKIGIREKFPKYIKEKMEINAGFFPATDENLFKFGEIMLDSCKVVDLYGVWFNIMEDFVIKKFSPKAKTTYLEALEPYRYHKPWSKALEGKNVLIIHPFKESIEQQYIKYDKIFLNKDVLPKFNIKIIKAVQSNAGGKTEFNDWFDALEYMYNQTKNIDYDIAILGCGAYGFPLGARLKRDGKKVIHLGGATQLLFGIRGARWDVRPEMQYLFNENWIRPNELEKPKDAQKVEGACYW